MNTYTIDQLINLQQVQNLLEAHTQLSGMACGLMDNEGNIITGVGLQQICTAFHWTNPASFARCWRNDPDIKQKLQAFNGDLFECRCQNGMINIAMPIIIEGCRLAFFFSGQFFYDDQPPDLAWFQHQAEEFGFDTETYLAAVRQAPLLSRAHVENTMGFLHQLVQLLTDTGHTNLIREREQEERKQREEQLKLFNFAFEHIREGAFLIELNQGKFLQVNQEVCRSLEYSRDELIGMSALDIDPNFSTESLQDNIAELLTKGTITFETDHRTKSGKVFPVELTATIFEYNDAYYSLSLVRNITERKQLEMQLQQQIAFQQTLLDRISMVGIQVMVIENGRIIYVGNRDLAYGFGYTDAELDAHPPFIEIVHPDEHERIMDYHRRRLEGEAAPTTYEIGLMTKAGERRDYETAVITLPDTDPVRIITVGKDITERKQTERQIKLLNHALDHVSEAVFLKDINEGRFLYVNQEACRSLGYSRDELIGMTTLAINPNLSAESYKKLGAELLKQGSKTFETTHLTKSGTLFPVEISATIFEYDGTHYSFALVRDIAERKQTEQQLNLLSHALDHVQEGAFLIDHQGRFIYVNQAACRSLDYDQNELLGKTVPDIDPDFSASRTEEHLAELFEAQSLTFETRHRTRTGETFPVEITTSVFEYGGVNYFLSLVRNIAERKRAEQVAQTRLRMLETISQPEISRQDCLRLMLDEIEALTNSSIAFYHFLEADQQTLSLQGWSSSTVKTFCKAEGAGSHYPVAAAGVWADAVRERRPVIHNDYATLPNRKGMPEGHAAVIRELVVPIFRGGSIVAIIGVGNKPTDYTEADLQAVALLGDFSWEIATRKLAEDRNRLREQEFRSLAESSPDSIIRYDLEHRILYLNNKLVQELGFADAGELIGKQPISIWPDGRFAAIDEGAQRAIQTGEGQTVELVWERFGQIVFGQILVVPERDVSGRIVGTLAFGREVTELKMMAESLRESEKKFRSLAENLPDNIVRYDTHCRMAYVNPRMEKTLGIPAVDLLGKTPVEKPPGTERGAYQEKIRQVLTTGDETEIDLILPDSGEGVRHHNIRFVAERDDDGSVAGVLAIGRDITERKQAEQRLHEKQQKLTEMALELSLAEERERQRIAAELHDHLSQSLLLGKIKLRSLISSPTVNDRHLLEEMLELQDRMIRSVRSLTQQLSPPILAVAGLVDALRWLAERMQEDYGLQVQVADDKQPIPLADDMRAIVFQACRELLINVAKHAQTQIARVIVGREGDQLYLAVEDQGVGFDQSGSTVNGFGLFSISERINYLGGHLVIESAPGRGTRVVLRVALAESRDAREVKRTTPQPPP